MKKFLTAFALILVLVLCLSACELPFLQEDHDWSKWETEVEPTCQTHGMKIRVCEDCGEEQTRSIDKLEHTEVATPDIPATCVQEGQTGGTHCSVCEEVLTPPTTTAMAGHDFSVESIMTPATCVQAGTKKIACVHCDEFTTESYNLEEYPATEINKQALQYVGEIIVFDKQDTALGLGTGFVYTADGKVITNYHVIDGAYAAQITINGETYEIDQVLAFDATIDLAVLKIDGTNLPHATLCSEPMDVGSTVYAIGSSRGMTNTFSQGIITYFDREVDGVSHIQHDVSITNGNSGGPLVNAYGEVVGVNTWGLADSQNLNFAVFIKELDNLTFGKAMTMAEFYNSFVSSPTDYLMNWVMNNYNYVEGAYVRYDDDLVIGGDDYYFSLGIDTADDYLYADLLVVFASGNELYVDIDFDADPSEYFYYCSYETTSGAFNETYGTINAKTFTENTPLTYVASEGGNWSQSALMELYQGGIVYIVTWMDMLFEDMTMPVSIADLGFIKF